MKPPLSAGRMHADEADIDEHLVRRLIAAQFPRWDNLPLERVPSAGTDNAMYRLGSDMAVRLPRIQAVTGQVDKEHRWLPVLAPLLPLAIPVPLAMGMPGEGYSWHWSVYRWLEGENATDAPIADLHEVAMQVAGFVAGLQRIDTTGGPTPGAHNFFRGVQLVERDRATREAIASLEGMLDTKAVTSSWEADFRAPVWDGPSAWIHGDIQSGNLLVVEGRLTAIIDFGGLGVGDPACDLAVAWTFFTRDTRATFRAALEVDDASWARGRAWALSVSLLALPYYRETNPVLAGIARRTIDEVLADHAHGA